jgi:rieske iron-sulfur protein
MKRTPLPTVCRDRRAVLKGTAGLALGFSLTPVVAGRQDDPASLRPRSGDVLVRINDPGMQPLTPGDISVAAPPTLAWAMAPADRIVRNGSRLNRVLVMKLDVAQLSADTKSNAAEGVVAYTAICTHSGCEVTDWLADERVLYCSCHSSKFDPADGARVADGPAPRSLPALPLRIADGHLVVAGPFTSRVGFESA